MPRQAAADATRYVDQNPTTIAPLGSRTRPVATSAPERQSLCPTGDHLRHRWSVLDPGWKHKMILIVVKHPVRAEHADGWPALMQEFTTATRAEPGNVCFDWYRSVDDPNVYVLVEAFRDRAAGEVHVKSEHFKAAIARLPQLLTDVPEIVNVDVPGDGWSRMAEVQVDLHH